MSQTNTLTDYDSNATDFDQFRQPSPIIAQILDEAFPTDQGPILSIGCGTGQYEAILSKKRRVLGLDRSAGMIAKAKERISEAVFGDMISLPFARRSFAGVCFMQSLHHMGANLYLSAEQRNTARQRVLKEAVEVVKQGPIFIIQRDPSQNRAVWFWKYFPKAVETKMIIQPKIATLVAWLENLGLANVTAKPIHDPMIRGFYKPEAPLDPRFRRSFSEFSYLSNDEMQAGVNKLKRAIQDGRVKDDITNCKLRFTEIGGTVFVVSGEKRQTG